VLRDHAFCFSLFRGCTKKGFSSKHQYVLLAAPPTIIARNVALLLSF
jgi:hypothetical protein